MRDANEISRVLTQKFSGRVATSRGTYFSRGHTSGPFPTLEETLGVKKSWGCTLNPIKMAFSKAAVHPHITCKFGHLTFK